MFKKLTLAALFVAALAGIPAHASVFQFTSTVLSGGAAAPGADLGNSNTFTVNGLSIVAKGYAISGATPDLYGKNGGADETGLGLTQDPGGDNEIAPTDYLQLDFADPSVNNPKKYNVTQVRIQFASVQAGETWTLWGSNVAGKAPGAAGSTKLLDSTALAGGAQPEDLLVIPSFSSYRYFSANVLLGQIEVTATPEPVSLLLVGSAFVGLGLGLRRYRRS